MNFNMERTNLDKKQIKIYTQINPIFEVNAMVSCSVFSKFDSVLLSMCSMDMMRRAGRWTPVLHEEGQ
jgi:hypothetical protein